MGSGCSQDSNPEKLDLTPVVDFSIKYKIKEEQDAQLAIMNWPLDIQKGLVDENEDGISGFGKLNDDLKLKTFLRGEGLEYSDLDRTMFALVKDLEIDPEEYPNLYRWKLIVEKLVNAECSYCIFK